MREGFYGLWYEQPAHTWIEALPLGNGRFGGMVYGGIQRETISLNEEGVWDGGPKERNNPAAFSHLVKMRQAIFAGQYEQAERIGEKMLGIPETIDSYQQLCSMDIDFAHTGEFKEYRRGLDISTAVHSVRYRLEGGFVQYGHWFEREMFVSAPDRQMVMRWTTDAPGGIDADLSFRRFTSVSVTSAGTEMVLTGQCCEEGTRFAAMARTVVSGGEIFCEQGKVKVRRANEVVIRVAGAAAYGKDKDPQTDCRNVLDGTEGLNYDELKQRHINDYRMLYMRQHFTLGGDPARRPVDAMISDYQKGTGDLTLFELWYNYLRYQLICSSRPGTLPSTLQGIWNDCLHAPWNSDFHPNANLQINYWPAEGYGLKECVEPLIEWMKRLIPKGEETARIHYKARGWVLHHLSDVFECTTPMDGIWGLWPFGGAWMCRHLYEHYLFNGNKVLLKDTILPIIEGAVLFMLDFLVECPEGIAGEGYLVTCPSHSPENRFLAADGSESWLTYAAAMDMEIIYDLFSIYLQALNDLEMDTPLVQEVKDARDRLAPLQISPRTGCLMEWIEDYMEHDPGHRHVSHLYALYPGTQITGSQPELLRACEASLERRLANHYEAQGWSCSWIASLFARLGRGDRALDMLEMIAGQLALPNLFVDAHGSPQVGDAQGIAACIQEMLVQSHTGEIHLLPALPAKWRSGAMEGIRVRGAHILDLYWVDGRLCRAAVWPGSDGELVLVTALEKLFNAQGQCVAVRKGDAACLRAAVKAGERYELI